MTYRYSLLDEEDELQPPDPTLELAPPIAAPSAQPQRTTYEDYLALRQSAGSPTQGAQPQPYEPKTYSPDYSGGIGAALAMGLDALMNKGRGVGKIAGAAANNLASTAERADVLNQRERQMALEQSRVGAGKQHDPLDQYLEYLRATNGQGAVANSAANVGLRAQSLDPNAAAQLASSKAGAATDARLDSKYAHQGQEVGFKQATSEATADGREASKAKNAEAERDRKVADATALAPIQAGAAAQRAAATMPFQVEGAKQRGANAGEQKVKDQGALRADNATDEALAQTGEIANAKKADEGQDRLADKDRTARAEKFNKEAGQDVELGKALLTFYNTLEPYRDPNSETGYQADLPGIGPQDYYQLDPNTKSITRAVGDKVNPLTGDDYTRAIAHLDARTQLKKIITGLAATDAETQQVQYLIGDPNASEAQVVAAMNYWLEKNKGNLQRYAVGHEDEAVESLEAAGLGGYTNTQRRTPSAAPAASKKTARAPAPRIESEESDAPTSIWIFTNKAGDKIPVPLTDADAQGRIKMGKNLVKQGAP